MACPKECQVELGRKINRLTIQWGLGIFVVISIFVGGVFINSWSGDKVKITTNTMKIQKGESEHKANERQLTLNDERLSRMEVDIKEIKADMVRPEQLVELITRAVKDGNSND